MPVEMQVVKLTEAVRVCLYDFTGLESSVLCFIQGQNFSETLYQMLNTDFATQLTKKNLLFNTAELCTAAPY